MTECACAAEARLRDRRAFPVGDGGGVPDLKTTRCGRTRRKQGAPRRLFREGRPVWPGSLGSRAGAVSAVKRKPTARGLRHPRPHAGELLLLLLVELSSRLFTVGAFVAGPSPPPGVPGPPLPQWEGAAPAPSLPSHISESMRGALMRCEKPVY